MLLGTFEQRLDEKNRATIPARLRDLLGDRVYVTCGFDPCLLVFPEERWNAFVEQHSSRLDDYSADDRDLTRYLFGSAMAADVDKQGRMPVPAFLVAHAELDRDIVLTGVLDRLEIWDRDTYTSRRREFEGRVESVAERKARRPDS